MNGELQTMVDEIMDARKDSQHLAGIGIISEATYDNPMIYDLIFDLAWAEEDFDLDQWISDYLIRRIRRTEQTMRTGMGADQEC